MSTDAAFEDFVHARSAALARTAYLLTGDHHLAEDLVQHALIQTARKWERIQTSPEAYARKAMYHQNISWWRKRSKLTETHLGAYDAAQTAAQTPAQPNTDPDLRMSLESALAQLTTKQRTCLVLRFFEDLTEVQTADALGISQGTVKTTTRQALARLRALAPDLADLAEVDA